MSVLDEVLCTGHGVGDVVPVLHYLEEKRTYTFASPAECGSPNTNNVYALYILPSQIGDADVKLDAWASVLESASPYPKTKQCNCASVDITTSFFDRLSCTTLF